MNALSTSSLAVPADPTGLLNLVTCYHVMGDVSRFSRWIFGSALRDTTDTASVMQLQSSEVGSIEIVLPAPASEACERFCDSLGLRPTLANCLAKAKAFFSNIVGLSAELDYFRDDQAEDIAHVVIRVEVKSDQQTALPEYDRFVHWMASEISPSDSQLFTVTVRRV